MLSFKLSKLNTVLLILAVLGVFATFDLIAHHHTPHFWIKLTGIISISTSCLFLTRDRQTWDTFFSVLAAIFTLFAIAMTFGDLSHRHWLLFFLGFSGVAGGSLLLARNKRETFIGIVGIVAFRLMIVAVVYGLRR